MCDIYLLNQEGFTHCGRLGMGVHKAYRKQGVGNKLITEAMAIAKNLGLERIELEVFASNIATVHLYEKLGFVHEGIKKKARKLDGQYDDILCMACFL